MAAVGSFTDLYCYEVDQDTYEEYEGSACSCEVSWKSEWKSGNTHILTITVQGIRTDGYGASLYGYIKVGENSTQSLGSQNYPGDPEYEETFEPVVYDVETDDYGNLLTKITVTVGFTRNADGSIEEHCARMTGTGVVLEKPQKLISISCPDGIICSVDKSPLFIDDEFIITVTVLGAQWSDSPVLSVVGAIETDDSKYKVTGDIYISVTGILSEHTITVTKSAGIEVSIIDQTNGYSYDDGSSVQHYSKITITCSVKSGYEFSQLKVNGEEYDNGSVIEVTSDITIVAQSNVLGLARIFTDASFEEFHILIYDGSSWGMYIPFIYDGNSWHMCA